MALNSGMLTLAVNKGFINQNYYYYHTVWGWELVLYKKSLKMLFSNISNNIFSKNISSSEFFLSIYRFYRIKEETEDS